MEVHPHLNHFASTEAEAEKTPRSVWIAGVKGLLTGAMRGFLLAGAAAIVLGGGLAFMGVPGIIGLEIAKGAAFPQIAAAVGKLAVQWGLVSAVLDGIHNAWHGASMAHKNSTKERFAKMKPGIPQRSPVYPQVAMVPQVQVSADISPVRSETHFRDMVDASRSATNRQL